MNKKAYHNSNSHTHKNTFIHFVFHIPHFDIPPSSMEEETTSLVFVPAPASGHLTPMIELAKLLVNRYPNLSITIITISTPSPSPNTDDSHLLSLTTSTPSSITFLHLSLQNSQNNHPLPSIPIFQFIDDNYKPISEAISTALSSPSPRPIALVVDIVCTQFVSVAESMGLPTYLFFICSAAFLSLFLNIIPLLTKHNEQQQQQQQFVVPGLRLLLPRSALPKSFIEKNSPTLMAMQKHVDRIGRMKAIMVNSFYELEPYAINSFKEDIPPVFSIGPLVNINKDIGDDNIANWLELQPDSSVVFLCFGSEGRFEESEIKEIEEGIELSGFRFIWSRSGNECLESGFLERNEGRGVLTGWAKQTAVLGHRAVGGFVSHCGWNSILESLWCGVPVAGWPLYAEQEMNCFELVEELGVGTRILEKESGLKMSEMVSRGIRRLMNDVEMREKVRRIQMEGKKAVVEGGLSFCKLGNLMDGAFL